MTIDPFQSVGLKIPQTTYYAPMPNKQGYHANDSEDHVLDRGLFTGAKVTMHQMVNNVFVYLPKALSGSVNSNFYEYLSLGKIPYVLGSLAFIACYGISSGLVNAEAKSDVRSKVAQVAAGVVLYGVGKWLGEKVLNKLTSMSTGIDPDELCLRCNVELAEGPDEPEKVRNQYEDVFGSAEFYRGDLLLKKGMEEGDIHKYFDKIAEKAGCKEKLNASDQAVDGAIRETIVKSKAAKSISPYFWAALGVGLAMQDSFGSPGNFVRGSGIKRTLKNFASHVGHVFKEAAVSLWTGKGSKQYPKIAAAAGKTLVAATVASTILGWLNVRRGFSKSVIPEDKSEVDFTKDYEAI